jgi:mitochondrial import inner membrane translocase subunit TIM50
MAHLYELVVFSSLSQSEAEPIMEKLDPYQFISYRLYRFATKYEDGVYKKDLTKLNRDLSKVLVFGHDPVFSAFPDNFMKVAPWNGDANDRVLESSLDFLEALAFSNSPDIREIVRSFNGQNIIETFDSKQAELYHTMLQQRHGISGGSTWKSWIMSIVLPQGPTSQLDLLPYTDRKNAFMMQRKADFEKDMERIKKEFARQMEANKEYLAANKMPLFDLVTKGPPPPPPELLERQASMN